MAKHSFALQIYLLDARFRQQQQIVWDGRGGVQDRRASRTILFLSPLVTWRTPLS